MLKNIEKDKGKTDTQLGRLSKEYANDIFGDEKYAPWLLTYSAMAGTFKEGWIPDNYYGAVVVPKLKGDYGKIDNRTLLTNSLLETSYPLDICYYVNNIFWDLKHKVLKENHLLDLLFKSNKKIVYKIENSLQGKGIYFFTRENFEFDAIKKLGNGVFQNYIEQHDFFSEFTNLSVATIRLTSVCDNSGKVSVRSAYLRIGKDRDTHVKSASAIKVPIHLEKGELSKYGYLPNWTSTEKHPNSKIIFENKKIPKFSNCISEVTKMHNQIPFVRCIGWDIIVDSSDKIRLIEWNGQHNDIKFGEATQGPCFKGLFWEKLV